eukprot:1179380-Prorocentrum_minimum.AAC.4
MKQYYTKDTHERSDVALKPTQSVPPQESIRDVGYFIGRRFRSSSKGEGFLFQGLCFFVSLHLLSFVPSSDCRKGLRGVECTLAVIIGAGGPER